MATVHGIHHVTAIASDAGRNLEFYVRVLGMRLVKKSVNQDDPGTYHLFYADAEGHPGSDVTFFPWSHLAPARRGAGSVHEISLAIPPGSLGFWVDRVRGSGIEVDEPIARFDEQTLTFADPDGLPLALVETGAEREFTPWPNSTVGENLQIRGIHAVRMQAGGLTPTASFLTGVLGFQLASTEDGWHRFAASGGSSGTFADVQEAPDAQPGRWGRGGVHHVAWRVPDDAHQLGVREALVTADRQPTPVIDRFWFKSVYFFEPGGVLFEIATDGPGFGIDEDTERLGETLILPPWLEPQRERIEAALPTLA